MDECKDASSRKNAFAMRETLTETGDFGNSVGMELVFHFYAISFFWIRQSFIILQCVHS